MVFVARYLITIDRSLLSSPHPQLVPFVIVLFSPFFSYAFLTSSISTPLNMFSLRAQLFSSFFFCSLICAFSPPSSHSLQQHNVVEPLVSRCFHIHPPLSISLFVTLVSLNPNLSIVLSFSCDLLGSHAPGLYLFLWEKRQPGASC